MRLKITFRPLGDKKLEIDYYEYLSNILQKFLRSTSMKFESTIHNEEYNSENMKFDLITFSQLFCPSYEIIDSELALNSNVIWYISSPINDLVLDFAHYIIEAKVMKVGSAELQFVGVEPVKSPMINNTAAFRCISPVCIDLGRENKTKYLPLENESFKKHIKNNLIRKFYFLNNKLPDNSELDIKILNMDKCSSGMCLYLKNDVVKCYMLTFEIKGSKELIKLGYEAGFGSHNSMGLGMVEIN